jgi:hypothetical protein
MSTALSGRRIDLLRGGGLPCAERLRDLIAAAEAVEHLLV